jgi:hypothetical protein
VGSGPQGNSMTLKVWASRRRILRWYFHRGSMVNERTRTWKDAEVKVRLKKLEGGMRWSGLESGEALSSGGDP